MLCLLALVWGSSFILMKKGLVVFSPAEVAAMRICSAGLFMIPLVVPKMKGLTKKQWIWLGISGATGSFLPAFLFTNAQTQLSSGLTGVLNAITPLFVLTIGVIFFRQKALSQQIIGLILGFTGSAVLTLSGNGALGEVNWYALLVIAATFCYGTNLNLIKFKLEGIRPVTITGLSLGIFTLPLLVYLLAYSNLVDHLQYTDGAWLAFSYIMILGVVGTALALILFNKLVQLSSPIFTSSVTYLIPLVALAWGVVDGEDLRPIHLVAMLIILVGVYITNRRKKMTQANLPKVELAQSTEKG
jgi:drug/metabolite transporter (DMT)-like permease